jgi:hypothetical protein
MKNTKFIKVALFAGLLAVTSAVFADEALDAFDGVPSKAIPHEELEKLSGKALVNRNTATPRPSANVNQSGGWGGFWAGLVGLGYVSNGVQTGGAGGQMGRTQGGGCGGGFGTNGNC